MRIQRLKRIGSRFKRFRYRKGYGVHSPFAFQLITEVIYEKYPYYNYADLESLRSTMSRNEGSLRVKLLKLIFRLVNWQQPDVVIDIGPKNNIKLPTRCSKNDIHYKHLKDLASFKGIKKEGNCTDLVFLHIDAVLSHMKNSRETNGEILKRMLDLLFHNVTSNSLFIFSGICYNKEMKEMWKEIQQDCRVGITFDLYDLGLVFFDLDKNKQHYLINF